MRIPAILFRVVPETTSDEVENWWARATRLHPDWQHVTYRDPIDPASFPISSPHWSACTSGAQRAGLLRLEALLAHGGIYVDSDVEVYRRLDCLRWPALFAGWEDAWIVPDAVLGAEPANATIRAALEMAIDRLGQGPWESGPGVITELFPDALDTQIHPPAVFYPYHWHEKATRRHEPHDANPWCLAAHHWAASWVQP